MGARLLGRLLMFSGLAVRGLKTGGRAPLVRLDKFLKDAGVAESRAAATKLIKQGRVSIDGARARQVGLKIEKTAAVVVDDAPVAAPSETLLWCYHKPAGVHSTVSDDRGRPDLSPVLPVRAHPVGRLDADTSGLLLFSSDGQLTHRLLSPRHGVAKEYVADCAFGDDAPDALRGGDAGPWLTARLAAGVETALGVHPADCLDVSSARPDGLTVRLVVREGKHRMVRRMLANCGLPVVALRRERFGDVWLGDLPPGAVAPAPPEARAWAAALLRVGGGGDPPE